MGPLKEKKMYIEGLRELLMNAPARNIDMTIAEALYQSFSSDVRK